MKLRDIELNFDTPYIHKTKINLQCPHCGLATYFIPIHTTKTSKHDNIAFIIQTFRTPCCNKHIFSTYKLENDNYEFISTYPKPPSRLFSDAIKDTSPRFVKLYSDSEFAESNNMIDLAGSGYRNSLEVLIKDFAIKELNKPIEEVVKKSLFNAIELYVPDTNLQNAADVIRILGNDFTHYERNYEELDFSIFKAYLDVFITRIESEYLIKHPPVSRYQKNKD